uniref:Nucleoprotein n=1 Tax=Evros rhabdovirus 2 TaxID=2805770 RepID=A0A899INB5_9RHAB|nr:MAG: nucleocapsid [Evros rhabdovirus 2]
MTDPYFTALGQPVNAFSSIALNNGIYPNEFFEANGGTKPGVSVRIHTDPIARIGGAFVMAGVNQRPTADSIVFMLYSYASQLSEVLDEDWMSYGIVIGRQGDRITPLSLLNIVIEDGQPETANYAEYPNVSIDSAMHYVFSPIRLDTPQAQYRLQLAARMENQIPGGKVHGVNMGTLASIFKDLLTSANYMRLASAYDMFLSRFPSSSKTTLRVGTAPTRYRDYSAMGTLSHLQKIAGIYDREIAYWIWNTEIARDFQRITDPRNEPLNLHSYAVYYSGMKLGTKSTASAAMNPHMHVFVHTVGSIMGYDRSKNAQLPANCIVTQPLRIGLVIAGIFMKDVGIKPQACPSAHLEAHRLESDAGTDIDDEEFLDGCPPQGDGYLWGMWLQEDRTGKRQQYYTRVACRVAKNLIEVRPNSIGERVKRECEAIDEMYALEAERSRADLKGDK